MLAKSSLTLVIECQVKDNVVSRKITNVVDVEQEISLPDGAKVVKNVGHASVDNLRADSGGLVVREIKPRYYKPGDEVTITVTASSVTGYFNNVTIKEAVSALQVETIDKGLVNPFDGKWTVTVQNNDTHSGGTTDGRTPDTGIVDDNEDLDVIIDVDGGDNVIYTIKGIVVDDASGEIDYRDDTVFPYDKQYRDTKTTIEKNYLPGSPLTYKINLKNLGLKHLVDLSFVDVLSTVKVEDTNGALVNAFTSWTIKAAGLPILVDLSTGAKPAYEAYYKVGTYENNQDINTKVSIPIGGEIEVLIHANVVGSAIGSITNEMVFDDNSTSVIINPEVNNAIINKTVVDSFAADGEPMHLKYSPGGTVKYTIVPTVNINMLSKIVVGASYGASAFPSEAPKLSENLVAEPVKPVISQMAVTKEAELHADNKGVTYTLTAVNPGKGNLASIHLFDNLSAITSKEGRPVFRSWTFNAVETKITGETIPVPLAPNQNLDMDWNFENNSRNILRISINALFQGNIDEEVMNVFKAIKPQDTGGAVQGNASIHVSHQSIGEGDLVVTKSALTPQIQPGGAVEYEINVNNPHDSYFEDVSIIDHYPAGFRYIEGTGKIKCANDEVFQPLEPSVTNVLTFYPVNLDPFQQCDIRYVLKPGIGIRPGSYKNTAFAQSDEGNSLSNQSNALVSVTGDKLFDTGSIIGKVFEDHNGNGYQSDATAKGIRLQVKIPQGDYVPNSLQLSYHDKTVSVINQASLFNKGLSMPDLWGVSLRPHSKPMSAKVSFISSKATPYPVMVSSTTGSSISLAPSGKIEQINSGNLAKGLSAEQLTLERKIVKVKEGFRHELTLTNVGRYDDGIPGVRLITAEGFKIETDEHGRFHVPDRWVLDSKGKNFVIKVDTDSLPDQMKVVSENPKVIRITPNKLNKVNFSV